MLNTSSDSNIRSVQTTYTADFSAFDQLPLSVRQVVAFAPYDIASTEILDAFRELTNPFIGMMLPNDFAADFERNMRCQVQVSSYTKLERYGEYKFGYPKKRVAGATRRVHERRNARQRSIFG